MTQNQLSQSPIHGHVDPAHFHPSPGHEEALARLHYVVEQHLRVGLLLGDAGSGKSMVLAKLAEELKSSERHVVRVSLMAKETDELLFDLATALGTDPSPHATIARLWRAIGDRLREFKYQQHATILLLDDADEATPAALSAVCRLSEIDPAEEARLTIVLAASARRIKQLPARLLDRAALRIDVEPWEQQDTLEFLTLAVERLRTLDAAGEAPHDVFTAAAIDKLHELSGGIPRRVSQLAQWALLAGAGLGLEQVDDETVASAAEELGVC